MTKNLNIVRHNRALDKNDYFDRNGHRPLVLWFTGLSGSGKSTLAHAVEEALFERGCYTYILDGDNIRYGLNSDLGFSEADRRENIRRIGEVARLFVDAGIIVMAAFISPFHEDRERVRSLFESSEFVEIYVQCDLNTCEDRDPKGLYRKARSGELKQFTGIDSPYEVPLNPEIVVNTACSTVEASVQVVLSYVKTLGVLA